MEQVVATLSPFTRRSRSLPVRGEDLPPLGEGVCGWLDLGEHVIVHDPGTGEHFSAVVVDAYDDRTGPEGPDGATYRLELGGRMTAAEAAQWLEPVAADEHLLEDRPHDRTHDRTHDRLHDDRLTTHDIVTLLAELRRGDRDLDAALAELRSR